jgi:hypothetical protein
VYDIQPMTGTEQQTPAAVVYLDLRAQVRLEERDGEGLVLVLSDGRTEVRTPIPGHADSGLMTHSLGRRIQDRAIDVQRKTVGYAGTLNGPGAKRPIRGLPVDADGNAFPGDPFLGGFNSGAC